MLRWRRPGIRAERPTRSAYFGTLRSINSEMVGISFRVGGPSGRSSGDVAMIWEVLVLGFVLSLDNFRVSIVLGTVPFGLKRAVQVAVAFGLWDGIMPLVGLLIGRRIGDAVGNV